jgi:hypothetical protein
VPNDDAGMTRGLIPFCQLWLGMRTQELEAMAQPILEEKADVHWVVAHGIGIALGNILRALQPKTPLHISIHDDPERVLFRRSRRFRLLARMVRKPMYQLLASAKSVDVTSDGMNEYYRRLCGIKSEFVHPYLCKPQTVSSFAQGNNELCIGHIGSIYSHEQFAKFLRAVGIYSAKKGCKPVLILIGRQQWSKEQFARELPVGASVRLLGDMREEDAIKELDRCDFVYAAYPFENSMQVFRQTSFPTKLSTYAQSQRPIFAHTPADSTLAGAVTRFQVGIVCSQPGVEAIANHIEIIQDRKIPSEDFAVFREKVFGVHNVRRLETQLLQA